MVFRLLTLRGPQGKEDKMVRLAISKLTVEPFLFLCMYACFLTWVTVPQLILDSICLRKHNQTRCAAMFIGAYKADYDIVQEQATLWFGGFLVVVTFIAVLALPFVGTISDRFGRCAAMFLTPVCQLLQALALFGILLNGLKFPTWALLLPGLVPAFVGDVSGLYVLTSSYISDITSEKTRTLRITLLDSVVLVAGLIATLCSGFIIEEFGYAGIYVTNIVSLILALTYLLFCVAPVNHKEDKSSRQVRIEGKEGNSLLDKEVRKALTKTEEEEVNAKRETGKELNTDTFIGRNNEVGNYYVNEVRDITRTRDSTGESSLTAREETGDISYRIECKLAENVARDDEGCFREVSNTETETCCTVWDSSKVDVGFKERNEKAVTDINEETMIGEGHLLNETTRSHSSKYQTRRAGKSQSDLASYTVDDYPCQLSTIDDPVLPIARNVDHYSTKQCTKTDERSGTTNVQKVFLEPQVEVLFQAEIERTLVRSELLHILKDSNPIRNFKRVYRVLKIEDEIFSGLILFLLMFFSAICYSGEMSVLALYLKNRPYFLSARDLGLYFAYESGIIAILGLVIFNYLFTRVIKMDDHLLLLMSFCSNTVYYTLLSVAQSLPMLFLIQLIHSVGSLNICIIRSLLSKIIPTSTTGLLFGALFMSETTGVLFGALICPAVYARAAVTYPGAVFFINGGLSLFSIFITSVLLLKIRKRKRNNMKRTLCSNVCDNN